MFTGLIQETGQIATMSRRRGQARITITAQKIAPELKPGDSVAVSGVCLTAIEIENHRFSADLAEETLKRTSLGNLHPGSKVNLELPATPQHRLGGHVVQGHVDGVGRLLHLEKIQDREDWRLAIEIPRELTRYVVAQGSIAVEGISLTVAGIHSTRVEIAIIPHTLQATNLHSLPMGARVNIEVDILAKYTEKMQQRGSPSKLRVEELVRRGF